MNVNFGLFPPMEAPQKTAEGKKLKGPERGAARKRLMSARALRDVDVWLKNTDIGK
jgi:methylenetetrahydrofolate--tRNA-(uracil-5-)-methyltransferase